MSLSILNNIPSLAAQNQLSITNSSLQKTLIQLSSGQRINSGADDAAGLSIADGLNANIAALTQSARNATDGVGKLQVADGALSQVTTLLNRAVTLATESANGTLNGDGGSQRTALQTEFASIKAEIDRIGQNTTFNGTAVFAAGTSNDPNVLMGATTGKALTDTMTTGDSLKITAGGNSFTYSYTSGDTVQSLLNQVNASNLGVTASLSSGQLKLVDQKGRGDIAIDSSSTATEFGGFTNAAGTGSNVFSVYLGDGTSSGASHIDVTLSAFSSSNLNGTSLTSDSLSTAAGAKAALTDINAAISSVAALRGSIGAGINRLQAATNVINNQTQNLTTAEDGVRSADVGQSVANLTKYNILTSTGISALAQANQMQQSVLKLLQ
ncbi:flagellin-like protein [Candidatus Koribacter versatilis Ellin345]|uniref:Flagellin n=1 Tax=Koribacter versatilis (strain Ellin345) TaxID=204669 RepID=Q1IMG4_KORVE|nr:flagellin [Candidatus Koribacter versatilis]ABF41936.1 flagellin-like protein [Candidatus Koribacter versatilis Ellin345]